METDNKQLKNTNNKTYTEKKHFITFFHFLSNKIIKYS